MNLNKKRLISKIVSAVTLALIAIFCVSIAAVSFHIYKTEGATPFSRETIGAHAVFFLPQMILAVAAAIASGVLALIFGQDAVKLQAPKDEFKTLGRVTLAAKKKAGNENFPVSALGERKIRLIYKLIFAIAAIAATVFSIIFATDKSRYSLDDINGDVLKVVLVILPLTLAILLLAYALGILARRSAARETAVLKQYIANGEEELARINECPVALTLGKITKALSHPAIVYSFKGAVLTAAIVFIIIGINNGGVSDVLGKAVRICTECIGLG